MLNIIDEFTREGLAILAVRKIKAQDVIDGKFRDERFDGKSLRHLKKAEC